MSEFAVKQINSVIEEHGDCQYNLRLVIKGQGCSTKNIDITVNQAKQIRKILADYITINDRVTLANDTSIVCGTVKDFDHLFSEDGPAVLVQWDDMISYDSDGEATKLWHNIKELKIVE